MSTELPKSTGAVVVGAGQAGIAASEHLRAHNIDHIVLEKDTVAESWKTRRWDSLVANGPAWHDKFPNLKFEGEKTQFVPKDGVADYMEKYAKQIDMPVFTGVTVTKVENLDKKQGFKVTTSKGVVDTTFVIIATGAFQTPTIPPIVPLENKQVKQIHSIEYKNPKQIHDLAEGGNILVVGCGSSGAQIADELSTAPETKSEKIYLSVGAHDRPPRSYRGRDFCWWLGVLNKWDMEAVPNSEHTTIAVSGAKGGRTMDFRELAKQGVVLVGKTTSYKDGKLIFSDDLKENVGKGDANYLSLLDEADEYIKQNGVSLPEEPEARQFLPDPECVTHPLKDLDLEKENIKAIIWATGFKSDYSFLESTNAVTSEGRPSHKRGISTEPGIYYLGLPWQTRRGSSFIWGVWYDAKYVGDHIAKQQMYLNYEN